jgi:hypothetical protein
MTYALIQDGTGVVANIIVTDANFVAIHYPKAVRIDNLEPVPCIGWRYVDGAFIPS